MTIDQLRQHHRAAPFRPFILHLTDGRSFRVDHPEFLSITGGGRTVIVGYSDRDAIEILDLLLVTSIEVLDSRSDNGAGRAA
ncbi:MAG: hypothetical protein IT436_16675 [Phycisphaerales bacterium]|nr:hypothetical protein [Phycisphaerales bacterium]